MYQDDDVLLTLYNTAEANIADECGGQMACLRNGAYSENGDRRTYCYSFIIRYKRVSIITGLLRNSLFTG